MNLVSDTFSKISKYLLLFFIISLFHGNCFAMTPSKDERKTIIVTGASGELGSATAKLLASDYDLILTGRDLAKLKKLQDQLEDTFSGSYTTCKLDFMNSSSRDHFKTLLDQNNSQIVGLVLITPRPNFYGKTSIEELNETIWLEVLQNTFTAPMAVLKEALPYLSHPSKIVVIAGTTSVQLQPEYGSSCVIRRMWTTYTKALSHQLGPQGISINALSPGVVLTNFHETRIQNKASKNGLNYDQQMEQEVANIPMHRHAKPIEVAQTIKFLISEQSDFINGTNLILDGGFTLSY